MQVVIMLRTTNGEYFRRIFGISDIPAKELEDVDEEHFDHTKYQQDRITRIGYALAAEHSAATAHPWYFGGWELPERLIPRSLTLAAGPVDQVPYWVLLPLWPLEDCLADSYYS